MVKIIILIDSPNLQTEFAAKKTNTSFCATIWKPPSSKWLDFKLKAHSICQFVFFLFRYMSSTKEIISRTKTLCPLSVSQMFNMFTTIFTDKLSCQKETYNAICADMDTTFAEMAGF